MDLSGFFSHGSGTLKPLQQRDDTLYQSEQEAFVEGTRQQERKTAPPESESNQSRNAVVEEKPDSVAAAPRPLQPLPGTCGVEQWLGRQPIVDSLGGEEVLPSARRAGLMETITQLRARIYNEKEGSAKWKELRQQIHSLEMKAGSGSLPSTHTTIDDINTAWVKKTTELLKEPRQNHSQKYSLPWRPPSPESAARRWWTMGSNPKEERYADVRVKFFQSDLIGGSSAGQPGRHDMENGFYLALRK